MRGEFTAVYEQDGEFYIGYCPEVPEANGQGDTLEECRESLKDAIQLVLETRAEDAPTRRSSPFDVGESRERPDGGRTQARRDLGSAR